MSDEDSNFCVKVNGYTFIVRIYTCLKNGTYRHVALESASQSVRCDVFRFRTTPSTFYIKLKLGVWLDLEMNQRILFRNNVQKCFSSVTIDFGVLRLFADHNQITSNVYEVKKASLLQEWFLLLLSFRVTFLWLCWSLFCMRRKYVTVWNIIIIYITVCTFLNTVSRI